MHYQYGNDGGGAERRQWRIQRGGSPVSKEAMQAAAKQRDHCELRAKQFEHAQTDFLRLDHLGNDGERRRAPPVSDTESRMPSEVVLKAIFTAMKNGAAQHSRT